VNAYSRLKRILKQQRLSVPELHRRIRRSGLQVNLKSLYRLSREDQPVERLDMRVAAAVCQVCDVPLSEWIVFEARDGKLRAIARETQEQLDVLMRKNNEGRLTSEERRELQALVREAEEIALANARTLADQRDRLNRSSSGMVGSAG
jgi:hypothetical protein